jgi:hypothetical protein
MPQESPVRTALAALLVAPSAGERPLAEALAELGFDLWLERGSDEACRRAAAGPDLVLLAHEIASSEGWALPRFLACDLSSRVPVVVFGPDELEEQAREVLEDLCVTYLPRSIWSSGAAALGGVLMPLLACAQRSVLLLDRPGASASVPGRGPCAPPDSTCAAPVRPLRRSRRWRNGGPRCWWSAMCPPS